jgi:hypothetical protein
MQSTTTERRDWNWDRDGELEGLYVETRPVVVKNGPSAGQTKLVFDFHTGLEDELVSAWETAVLRSKFLNELRLRRKPDFEPGERIRITPKGTKEGEHGSYRDFDVSFEHAAPKKSTAELLGESAEPDDGEEPALVAEEQKGDDDADLPF